MGSTRVLARLVVVALVAALAPLLMTTSAGAAPAAPTGLAPDGTNVNGAPILSWDRVAGVTGYDVQVSGSSTFSSLLYSVSTKNSRAVPTVTLPENTYWRVRATDGTGASAWSSSSFTIDVAAPPALQSPADGSPVEPPNETALLRWSAVPGAGSYTVWISPDPLFTDPALRTEVTTKATSHVATPSVAGVYYWRVQADLGGVSTDWSDTWSFEALGLAPINADTAEPNHEAPSEYVEDVILDWDAVKGAVRYEYQIDNDNDFDSLLQSGTVISTRTAVTVKNDEYYWRVRAVDAQGVVRPWPDVPVFTFRRAWPDQPKLSYPADGAVVGDPLYFQWTPHRPGETEKDVRLASRYTLQISPDRNFEFGVQSCTTVHTNYVPSKAGDCWPTHGGVWWWRVQGRDGSANDSPGTDLIGADERSFTYDTWVVSPGSYSPVSGHSGPPPTLSWGSVLGAAKYKVQVTRVSDGMTTTVVTAATSYSPRDNLKPKSTVSESYRWQVIPITADGREGNSISAGGQPTFTVTSSGYGTAAAPEPTAPANGTAVSRFPTLKWTPMEGADTATTTRPPKYQVYIRAQGAAAWQALPGTTRQAAFQATESTYLNPGTTYEWRVEAFSDTGAFLGGSSSIGSFNIKPLGDVEGARVSLDGSATDALSCDASLPAKCPALPESPVLSWDPVANAGSYRITISFDREQTNVFKTVIVSSTRYRPDVAFPDSQAGTAYYWIVQPCTADQHCNPLEYAQHAFEKKSDPVELAAVTSAPCTGGPAGSVCDDVTVSWNDYVDSHPLASSVGSSAEIEADKYHVQVATNPSFAAATLVVDKKVDQTEFTASDTTYPEGELWWRVQAIDASGNTLPWSDPADPLAHIVKRSPAPALTSPVGNQLSNGAEFSWAALDFAAAYELEVYKNDDTSANVANRMVSQTGIKLTSFTAVTPLPVSSTPYVWRVRRIDAAGRKGAWSTWGRFRVAGASPTYATPANGASVAPNDGLFTWNAPPTAGAQPASYRFQRRKLGTTGLTEDVGTKATAWAPTATLADGTWEWRVVALDTAGKEIGSTGNTWRQFTVSGKPVANQAPILSGSGEVGSTLTVQAPTWTPSDVTERWEWLRNNAPIDGATDTTYELTSADLGRQIRLRVTASKPGYADGITLSEPVTVVAGGAPQASPAVHISGNGKVGTTLTSTPPVWDAPVATEAYQWYREDTKILGATGRSYVVQTDDVGRQLTLQVTATRVGYANGLSISNAITGVSGGTLVAITAPSISGQATVGSTLSSQPGTWPSGARFTYQWRRDGEPIPGATSSLYRLVAADATASISLQVVATKPGFDDGAATSNTITVARMTTTAQLRATTGLVRPGRAVRLTLTIIGPGGAIPVGKFQIQGKRGTARATVLASGTLTEDNGGVRSLRVRLRRTGTYSLRVRYLGNAVFMPSKSVWATVIVRR